MTRHLDDHEIAAAVAGLDLAPECEQHLGSCLECRRQLAATQQLIARRRQQLAAEEPDWEAARRTVLDRIDQQGADGGGPSRLRPWRQLAAAAAAVAVAVVVGLLAPRQADRDSGRTELAVDEILAEVDAVLDDDSIPGFEVIDPGLDALEGYVANGAS
jgi:anti-sigma factor RsiW